MNSSHAEEFAAHVASYRNTAEGNDATFAAYTALMESDALLASHRRHVEAHKLGFGDRAHHALWQELLAAAHQKFGAIDVLEIGVFKGQIISLWALLACHHDWTVRIHAISPLEGQPLPGLRWKRWLLYRISQSFRERVHSGDFYDESDYETIVRNHFSKHGLNFDDVHLLRGYSTDRKILDELKTQKFHIVYIDGDHTFAGVSADIQNYASRIVPGGWLVMDDAGYNLPGTSFWKGYEAVARACAALPDLGFENIINVSHNCVFQRKTDAI